MNTQTIQLDVGKRPAMMPSLTIGQGDKAGTTLACEIYDNGQALDLTGLNVKFAMRLPHQQGYYEVDGTASGNTATFVIDETYAAAVAGTTDVAYVEILQGTSVIASTNRIHVTALTGAKTDADPAGAYSNVIDAELAELSDMQDDAEALIGRLTEVEGGYVISCGGEFDGTNLVLGTPPDVELYATDLADARTRLATLETAFSECCTRFAADLATLATALAPLQSSWLYIAEGLYAPTAQALVFSGDGATAAGSYSDSDLVLS